MSDENTQITANSAVIQQLTQRNAQLEMVVRNRSIQGFNDMLESLGTAVMLAGSGDQNAKQALARFVELLENAKAARSSIALAKGPIAPPKR